MDFGSVSIGGLSVLFLVLGWVQAAKKLGVEGRASFVLALVLGFVFFGLNGAIQQGMVPPEWIPWIEAVVMGLGGSLAATGLYDLVKSKQMG